MKLRITAWLTALVCLLGLSAVPAQAAEVNWDWGTPATAKAPTSWDWGSTVAEAGPDPIPYTILTSYKFWPYAPLDACVALGATPAELPIGIAAQAWNNATEGVFLNAEANCVTAGYSPSTRMTIDSYSAADGQCYKLANTYYAEADTFRRWTGNPANIVGFVNLYYEGCREDKAKWTSYVIGRILGAAGLTGSTWANRVMSRTSGVQYPSATTDGPAISGLYRPQYWGLY